jgi:NlpC/P60 family putative phage cell wall peptidase
MSVTRRQIVAAARCWIGTPYHHQASLIRIGSDCLGLVRGVWRDVIGYEPEEETPYGVDWAEMSRTEKLQKALERHFNLVELRDYREGDVLLFRFRENLPAAHLGVATTAAHMVHAHSGAGVTETEIGTHWRRRLVAAFAFPGVIDEFTQSRDF